MCGYVGNLTQSKFKLDCTITYSVGLFIFLGNLTTHTESFQRKQRIWGSSVSILSEYRRDD